MINKNGFFVQSLLVAVLFAAVVVINPANCAFAQEATTEKEIPAELKTPARTAVDAIDEQTAAQKAATAAQIEATKANTAAIKAAQAAQSAHDADAREAASKKDTEKKPDMYYAAGVAAVLLAIGALVFVVMILRKKRPGNTTGGPGRVVGMIALCLIIGASAIQAAPCTVSAGQPFVVSSLTVVRDASNPTAPNRAMIMPDQERKFQIKGCGFGWDVNQVVVGFSGTKVGVSIDEVTNDHMIVRVKPEADAALNYRNLAVAVTDQHGRKNLIHTPLTLEVAPEQAYWALQAQEHRPVGTIQQVSGAVTDRTARAAAVAAAHNANAALDLVKTNSQGIVDASKAATEAAKMAKDAVSQIGSLRKDVDDLKAFAKSADAELYYQDGSSRVDDLSERIEALENKPASNNAGVSKLDIEQLRWEVNSLKAQVASYGNVTVGTLHQGTIAQKAAAANNGGKKAKKGKPAGAVRNAIQ